MITLRQFVNVEGRDMQIYIVDYKSHKVVMITPTATTITRNGCIIMHTQARRSIQIRPHSCYWPMVHSHNYEFIMIVFLVQHAW